MAPFHHSEATRAFVRMKDGTTWECTVSALGTLIPVRQVDDPPPPPSPVADSDDDEDDEEEDDEEDENEYEPPTKDLKDKVFREKLSNVMSDNRFDRRIRGQKRGKLDMQRLWKAETGATNLFTQKKAMKNKYYNVILVVDESGSMSEQRGKAEMAAEVAVTLSHALEGIGIDYAVIGFNRFVMVHKEFEEKVDNGLLYETIVKNTREYTLGANDNNDLDALSRAYKMLAGRKGKNIVIFCSDGAPVPSGSFMPYLSSKEAFRTYVDTNSSYPHYGHSRGFKDPMGKAHEAWMDTNITGDRSSAGSFHHMVNANKDLADTIGVGIMSECWQIPDNVSEYSLEKIKPLILEQVKKKIKRG